MRVDVPLLRHQHEFVSDFETPYLALVGGYGSGKTRSLVLKMILLASKNVGCDLALLAPTNSMGRDVLQPELDRQLQELNLPYTYRASPLPSYTVRFSNGSSRLLLRSCENYRRLLGLNLAGFGCDELDSIPTDVATAAWRVLMSRLRAGNIRQGFCSTTPEGYKFVWQFWVKEASSDRKLIRARTEDNPFLPEGFIESLLQNFPPELVASYLNGEFTNLTQGKVYSNFDRVLNACNDVIAKFDMLHAGCDFNVGKTCCLIHVLRDGQPRAVDELVGCLDTPGLIKAIQQRYPEHCLRGLIVIYPDASGAARDSTNANPKTRSRILAVNAMLCNARNERRYLINIQACPSLVESLEQQVYDASGQPDKTRNLDHSVDAAGYFVHKMYPIANRRLTQGPVVWQ